MRSDKEAIKEEVRKNVIWTSYPVGIGSGGQSTHSMPRGASVYSPDMDFAISINAFRSQLRNKEVAHTLFELALEEWVK